MTPRFEFEIVSPEQLLLSRPAEMAVLPGVMGEFGVLPDHVPLVSELKNGVIRVYENGEIHNRIFVAGGFAEVTRNRATVLAEFAIPVQEINIDQLESEKTQIQTDLANADDQQRKTLEKRLHVVDDMIAAKTSTTDH